MLRMKKEDFNLFFYMYIQGLLVIIVIFTCFIVCSMFVQKKSYHKDLLLFEGKVEQISENLDEKTRKINDVTQIVVNLESVKFFSRNTHYIQTHNEKLLEMYRQCIGVINTDEYILDYMVISQENDLVITNSSIETKDSYLKWLLSKSDYDREEFIQKIFEETYYCDAILPGNYCINSRGVYSAIPFVTTVYSITTHQPAVFVLFVNIEKMISDMLLTQDLYWQDILILNEENQVLYSMDSNKIGMTIQIPDTDSDEIYYKNKASVGNLQYVFQGDIQTVYYDSRQLMEVVMIAFIIAMILMMFFVYFSTSLSKKPIVKLIDSKVTLSKELELQKPVIETMFMERLLAGNFDSEQEVFYYEHLMGIPDGPKFFCVAVLKYMEDILPDNDEFSDMYYEYEKKAAQIKKYLKSFSEEEMCYIQKYGMNTMTFLFYCVNSAGDSKRIVEQKINKLAFIMQEQHLEYRTLSVGSITNTYSEIPNSLENAMTLILNDDNFNGIIYYDEGLYEDDSKKHFWYPPEIENKLIQNIYKGNIEMVNNLLRSILQKNILENTLEHSEYNALLTLLNSTVLRAKNHIGILSDKTEREYLKYQNKVSRMSIVEQIYNLKKVIGQLALEMAERKKNKSNELRKDMEKYILENFQNPDLSLKELSDAFHISTVYVSVIMTKGADYQSFNEYLLSVRMKKAVQLLLQTDEKIQEIAIKCGYYSINSFGKAFQRAFGMSPTKYRDMQKPVEQKNRSLEKSVKAE